MKLLIHGIILSGNFLTIQMNEKINYQEQVKEPNTKQTD